MEAFIQQVHDEVVNKLSSDAVLSKLWAEGIITTDEYDDIDNLQKRGNRIKLMRILRAKNDIQIHKFIEAVEESTAGQEDLVDFLRKAADGLNLRSPTTKLLPEQFGPISPKPVLGNDASLRSNSSKRPGSLLEQFSPTATKSDAIPIPSMVYEMGSGSLGHALIINNISFANDHEEEYKRKGAEKDTEKLGQLFTGFGLNTYKKEDVVLKDFQPLLQEFKELFNGYPADSSIVVVMSHGDTRDRILTSDHGSLQIHADILQQFNNEHFPQMIGKPKIFIFQSCRGDTVDRGSVQKDSVPISSGGLRIPTWTDMLVCYSTLEGHYAYRDTLNGSWFIQILCEVFREFGRNLDICKMLNIVAERMKEKEGTNGAKQICPWTNIGFTKEFYFARGR